jgi:hypothetical protein
MLLWVVYGFLVPLLGIVLIRTGFWILGIAKGFSDIIKDGQLCFFCTTVSAATLNDLLKTPTKANGSIVGFGVAALILCMLLATFIFGVAVNQASAITAVAQRKIALMSGFVLLLTIVFTLLFRWLTGVDHAS